MVHEAREQNMRVDWWGRFEDPAVELLFREYQWTRERRLALFSMAIGIVLTVIFAFSDRQLLGATPVLWYLLSGRAVFVVGSALLIGPLLRPGLTPATMDRLLALWAISGILLSLAIGLTRPGIHFLGQGFVSLFVLWIFYFAAPLRLPVQVSATLLMVAGQLYMLLAFHRDLDPVLRRSVIVGYTVTVLVAIVASRNLHHLRRQQFANLQQEKALRTSLETALAEVRTLQGILPICSYCKSVRDDLGSWQKVEDYVRSHSNAEFSHGICPDCIRIHFGAYVRNHE
jgi:hypothetical protein